jgi:hypothetical protein
MESERYLDYDSAVECEEDATSIDVTDSVSAHIVQVQGSDFAAMEEKNSAFFFGSFSQDSESKMVQMIFLLRQSSLQLKKDPSNWRNRLLPIDL